jgi:hypothetical protein
MRNTVDHSPAQAVLHLGAMQPGQAAYVQASAQADGLSKQRQRIAQRMMKALAAMTPEACEHILGLTEAFALKHPAGPRLHLVRAGTPSQLTVIAPVGAR